MYSSLFFPIIPFLLQLVNIYEDYQNPIIFFSFFTDCDWMVPASVHVPCLLWRAGVQSDHSRECGLFLTFQLLLQECEQHHSSIQDQHSLHSSHILRLPEGMSSSNLSVCKECCKQGLLLAADGQCVWSLLGNVLLLRLL